MTEYCPTCGHVVEPEVGFGASCGHCRWVGLRGSKDPRRDTRDGPEPAPAFRSGRGVDPGFDDEVGE